MRPPEFTGGNLQRQPHVAAGRIPASMRPPEFTGGNINEGSTGPNDDGKLQ